MNAWPRLFGALLLTGSLLGLGTGERALDVLRGADSQRGFAPQVCSFRARTGVPCLGCGGTRALGRMARGDLPGALAANALGAFAGLALWALAAVGVLALGSGRPAGLKATLALLVALAPAAFVWNFVRWWLALPPGSLLR